MMELVGGVATPTTTVGEGCGTVTAYIQTYRDFLKSKVEFWDTECFFNWILKYWTKKPIGTEKSYMETRTAQFSFMQQIAHKSAVCWSIFQNYTIFEFYGLIQIHTLFQKFSVMPSFFHNLGREIGCENFVK